MNEIAPLQTVKSAVYDIIKTIKQAYPDTRDQPWLHETQSLAKVTPAGQAGYRADLSGKIRFTKASDLGQLLNGGCQKSFAATYAGRSMSHIGSINPSKAGTTMHKQLEFVFPNYVYTSKRENDWGTYYYNRKTITLTKSIGKLTQANYTGTKKDGIRGELDGYINGVNSGLELKTEWKMLPDEVGRKALGQGAIYAAANNLDYMVWLYLPADLRALNPLDPTTYRVFIKTALELAPVSTQILADAQAIASLVDTIGFEKAYEELTCFNTPCVNCRPEEAEAYYKELRASKGL